MNYDDEQLSSEGGFLKMANEFVKKFEPQSNGDIAQNASNEELDDVFLETLTKLSQNEQWLTYLNQYLNKNNRYKVTAQQVKLDQAIETTKKHMQTLQSLKPNISIVSTPLPTNKNVKTAIYNCCNNQGSILKNLLWLLLLKNLLSPNQQTLQTMAYEEAQMLERMFELF